MQYAGDLELLTIFKNNLFVQEKITNILTCDVKLCHYWLDEHVCTNVVGL